jgi:hypothetical protein
MTSNAQRVFRPAIIIPQRAWATLWNLRRLANRRRPRVEAGGSGSDSNVGIYQRGSAQAATAYYHNRGVNIYLVKPERVQGRIISLLDYVFDRVRETADRPFLPALKQTFNFGSMGAFARRAAVIAPP